MIKVFTYILISMPCFSCASNDKKHNETLAAISTVSAIVVAIPLLPFAEAYHVINDTEGKNRERAARLAEKFDPIYLERIEIIESRNPEVDANQLIERGAVLLLPSVLGGGIFPGLKYEQTKSLDREQNTKTISENDLASYLSALMGKDSAHQELGEFYYGDPFKKFISTGWSYKEIFNTIMYVQIQKSSNKSSKRDAASGAPS